MMERDEILKEIRRRLEALYGPRLKGIVLYGSEARGEAGPDSDFDILVLLEGPLAWGKETRSIIDALYDLVLEGDRLIHAIPMEEARYRIGDSAMLRNALREGMFI